MNQVELLLRISENCQEKGDEIAKRYSQERAEHVRELNILLQMIDTARQNVQAELSRFGGGANPPSVGQFAKGDQPPAPGFLTKGGSSAAQAGVEPRDNKPEHPRAIPLR